MKSPAIYRIINEAVSLSYFFNIVYCKRFLANRYGFIPNLTKEREKNAANNSLNFPILI